MSTRRKNDETDKTDAQRGFEGEGGSAALRSRKTLAELTQEYEGHASQVTAWKAELLTGAEDVFADNALDATC